MKKPYILIPANLSEESTKKKADIILLTHSHDDHFSIETLKNLVKPTTIIVCPSDCEESLIGENFEFNIYVIKSGENIKLNRVKIEAIPAYSSSVHPSSAGWVDYVIEINGFRIYHSGDTGFTPEMSALTNVDIAFVTVREPYMMSPKEVIQSINVFKPKILIPIHWIEEEKNNIDYIIKNAPESTKVIILELK
ncbi:MAG: MBL fold metallo-hydrolase [Candidatus Lokiarchaeota archaeon]|nr:MBL fold metallo-hydrolase [Candidatus Lokiarchaeota archaeon]